MVFNPRNLVLLITLVCCLHQEIFAEHSWSTMGLSCNQNANFPVAPCCGVSNQLKSRIFGHKKAELNEFPWLVYINKGHGSFTGGSLINSRWVLSSAHSFQDELKETYVHLGEWNITADIDCIGQLCKPKAKIIKVDSVINHESYHINQNVRPENDVALLHLAETVTFSDYIRPLCLPFDIPAVDNFANKMAVVAGWGVTESGTGSDVLLKAWHKVLDAESCGNYMTNDSIHICTTSHIEDSTCTGDSGGPLMLQLQNDAKTTAPYYQIGVVSYGPNGCGNAPEVYANVRTYVNWINNTMLKYQRGN